MNLAQNAGAAASTGSRPIPPFAEEHDEFRPVVRRFGQMELYPAPASGKRRAGSERGVQASAELGDLGLKFPPEYDGGGDIVADAVLTEELVASE